MASTPCLTPVKYFSTVLIIDLEFVGPVKLTHYDGVSGTSVSAQSFPMLVRLVNTCGRLLIREVAILS